MVPKKIASLPFISIDFIYLFTSLFLIWFDLFWDIIQTNPKDNVQKGMHFIPTWTLDVKHTSIHTKAVGKTFWISPVCDVTMGWSLHLLQITGNAHVEGAAPHCPPQLLDIWLLDEIPECIKKKEKQNDKNKKQVNRS